ncbi:MAG TPA: hypothetical protein VFX98_07125 [Longimicrobiaceae bacterium]|nr:hypothetical protein [Longimicrobiaceae bacterium]
MKKLRLDFDKLQVETFDPTAAVPKARVGTVHGNDATRWGCTDFCTDISCFGTGCGEATCASCAATCDQTCAATCAQTCANTCAGSCGGSCGETCGEFTCFSCGGSCEWTCGDTCWGSQAPMICC